LAVNQPEDVQRIWARSSTRRSPAEWALHWIWDHPEVVTLLSGMNAPAQLQENLATAGVSQARSLGAQDLALVEEVRGLYTSRMRVPCTTCGYCIPCPSDVAIPDVFSSYNTGSMFNNWKDARGFYESFVAAAGHGADQCLECGTCEDKCPQHIPIMEKLKEARSALTA
jgi:predicted aldo/keto reductase-like oxidoreductase